MSERGPGGSTSTGCSWATGNSFFFVVVVFFGVSRLGALKQKSERVYDGYDEKGDETKHCGDDLPGGRLFGIHGAQRVRPWTTCMELYSSGSEF